MDSSCDGEPWIKVGDIIQYHYCPRKVYFLEVMGVPAPVKRKMALGNEEHEKELKRLEKRKLIFGIKRDLVREVKHKLYLKSEVLGLHGIVDTVIFMDDEIIPVEVKFTDFTEVTRGRRKQLVAYAMLIEENFNSKIKKGIIYFTGHKKTEMIDINYDDKKYIMEDIKTIRKLFLSEKIPRKVNKKKCEYCEVSRYCV